jgi:hypothetical protein
VRRAAYWVVVLIAAMWAVEGVSLRAQAVSNPLQFILSCTKVPEPTLRFTIRNVSDASTAAVIGSIIGTYRVYSPDDLKLVVRRAGNADTTFELFNRSVGVIGGRIDQWLLALPAGATFSMPLPLRQYSATEQLTIPAAVQLRLTTHSLSEKNLSSGLSDQRFIPLWIGTLTSNWLRFPDECDDRVSR